VNAEPETSAKTIAWGAKLRRPRSIAHQFSPMQDASRNDSNSSEPDVNCYLIE